jgi:hypothetical protein
MGVLKDLLKKLRGDKKYGYRSMQLDTPTEAMPVQGGNTISNYVVWDSTNSTATPLVNTMPVQSEEKFMPKDERIEKKPVELVSEIVNETPAFDCKDIKRQIKVVKRRLDTLLRQRAGAGDEKEALMYLEARAKFAKYHKLFNWPVTNEAKIIELCKKYKVQKVGFAGYARNIPMEAIDEIEKFEKAMSKVTDREPELSLIIDVGGKEQKKDPILLAKSPFGRWYYVCGAWDKEVEIVDKIIYDGK